MTDYNLPSQSAGILIDWSEIRRHRWYAVLNDTIGGYAVSNVNKPVSKLEYRRGEVEVACFVTQDDAEHIADLHNRWINQQRGG